MNKKLLSILISLCALISWLFIARPHPPFGGSVPVVSVPTYFAEIDSNGIVLRVIVADQEFINSGKVGDPKNWVQTYYDNSQRKHYAGKGYLYDKVKDEFYRPQPFSSWIFDDQKADWVPPIPYPSNDTTRNYDWDEINKTWKPK